jgi:sugar O-acyltransferase (sialic acid O-acetyltransferase NeuD family)
MFYIFGSGGFAKEVFQIIEESDLSNRFKGFIEPDALLKKKNSSSLLGFEILPLSSISLKSSMLISIGDGQLRRKIVEEELSLDLLFPNIIHPKAIVSKWVELAEGAIICAGVIITVDVKIGRFAQLNLNTTIGHDCQIGDYFTSALGVHVSGNCTIGDFVYIGTGAVIKQGITICSNVTIGMGAVVTKDITEPGTYIGSPARKLEKK